MASVREVYNTLKDIANKDERGFITPEQFNSIAPTAQLIVFNSMFSDLTKLESYRKRNIDSARDKSQLKQIKEDMSIFSKKQVIPKTGQVFNKPDDYAKAISLTTSGAQLLGVTTTVTIDIIYDEEKLNYVLQSDLSKPSESAPIAFLAEEIHVYPSMINKVIFRYYKQPEGLLATTGARTASMPKFGFTVVNNKEVYNAATSVDFELPEHYTDRLVFEMAKMIGVNLRDNSVYTYANNETTKQNQQ